MELEAQSSSDKCGVRWSRTLRTRPTRLYCPRPGSRGRPRGTEPLPSLGWGLGPVRPDLLRDWLVLQPPLLSLARLPAVSPLASRGPCPRPRGEPRLPSQGWDKSQRGLGPGASSEREKMLSRGGRSGRWPGVPTRRCPRSPGAGGDPRASQAVAGASWLCTATAQSAPNPCHSGSRDVSVAMWQAGDHLPPRGHWGLRCEAEGSQALLSCLGWGDEPVVFEAAQCAKAWLRARG